MEAPASRGRALLTTRQQLAAELGRLRDQAGISGRELGQRVGISQSKVSRIESGSILPSLPEVRAWAEVVGTPRHVRHRLTDLAEAAFTEVRAWRLALRERGHLQDDVRDREARAELIRTFQPSLVPGLLQTAEYAREVFSLFQVPYDDAEAARVLTARLDRQRVLFEPGRRAEFLLTEAALRWRPDLPEPLALAQLDRLRTLSTLDSISVGILTQRGTATTAIPHGFVMYSTASGTLVTVETVHAELVVTDPGDVALYEDRWSLLHRMAIFGDDARAFLATLRPASR